MCSWRIACLQPEARRPVTPGRPQRKRSHICATGATSHTRRSGARDCSRVKLAHRKAPLGTMLARWRAHASSSAIDFCSFEAAVHHTGQPNGEPNGGAVAATST